MSLPDSSYVQGVVTDIDGKFSLAMGESEDRLLFRMSMIGYETTYAAAADEVAHIDIKKIKDIELNLHPGARYGGNVGTVVTIRTHAPLQGLTAMVRSQSRINHRFSQGLTGEIRYQTGNVGITLGAMYDYKQLKSRQESTFELLSDERAW